MREQVELYESSGGTRGTTLWDTGLPVVILTTRGAKSCRIREIAGDEKADWWERAVAAYPPYAEYLEKTARVIPGFLLEPARG